MIYKFTNRAEKAIAMAQECAAEFGHNYVGTEHLLCGLVREGTGLAYKVLEEQNVTEEKIEELIDELIGREEPLKNLPNGFTPRTKRVFEISFMEAKRMNNNYIGTEHLLLGILKEGDSVASRIIMELGVDIQKLFSNLIKMLTDEKTGIKYPLADYELLPNMAIIDTNYHLTAPKGLTAASGIDAVTHALEAYASMMATDYTDGLALQSLKVIFEYLPRAYDNGANDPVAREKMANAATMAGMAFANAFLGVCHSMAHKLGAYHHLAHGIANALLLEEEANWEMISVFSLPS